MAENETNFHSRSQPWVYLLPLTLFLVFHLLLNFATIGIYPIVWGDEVRLADPGVNLYLGNGYTSSSSPEQDFGEPVPDRPLYPFALAGWLTLFGFSLPSVRGFAHVCAAAAVFLGIVGVRRSGLVVSTSHLLLLAISWLWSYGAAFAYRASRSEPLIMLLLAAGFAASTIRRTRIRIALLILSGILLALAGLQSVVFLIAFTAFCGPLIPKQHRISVAVLTCAAIAGTILMIAVFAVLNINHAGFTLDMFWHESLLGVLLSSNTYTHVNNIPKSPSLLIFSIFIILDYIMTRNHTNFFRFSLVSFLSISGFFVFFAHFPTYYTWFVLAPAVTAIVADIKNQGKHRTWIITLILCSMCAVGLPFQLGSAMFYKKDRDYRSINSSLRKYLESSDRVYSDYSAYYTVKAVCPTSSYFGEYIERMSDDEKRGINVLIITPKFVPRAKEDVGGKWNLERPIATPARKAWSGWSFGAGLLEANYNLILLRRPSENQSLFQVANNPQP